MGTISNERIDFNPQRDILRKTMGAWCLCPTWMAWMPWLVDGDEVLQTQGKTIEKDIAGRHHPANMKGL